MKGITNTNDDDMKTSVNQASVEELIDDICHYEDPDTFLLISNNQDGGVCVSDQEWSCVVSNDSLKGALISYQLKCWDKIKYTRSDVKEELAEHRNLDWTPVLHRLETKEETPSGDQAH